ncbi:MAG TPA: glycosyltransferase family 9 protein, partial [Ktedonobacterales bacterium]|nr:glycosyltransferase family 9 protein [Ktedonobacterales bacterium]
GPPALRVAADGARRRATCASLFRVGVREYAARGPLRRYADCVEDLLALPPGSVDGHAAQPTLRLQSDDARFAALAAAYGLRPGVPLIVGCFQSAVVAKCYGHWRAVLDGIGAHLADAHPGAALDVLIACGPDDANPPGARYSDLVAEFAGYRGSGGALRAVVARTATLGDLACCLRHAALALTNDSAPGHIAGALGIPVITPYLPGDVYSLRVWASTLAHHGVTSDAPFTRQQLENAVLWDHTDVIDSIAPARLLAPALAALAAAGVG